MDEREAKFVALFGPRLWLRLARTLRKTPGLSPGVSCLA